MASEWNGPIIDEFTFDDPTIFGSPTITGPIIPVEPEEPATLEGVMDNDHGEWFGLDFWNGGGQPRQLRELTKGDWRPTRMRFEGLWTEEELPSIWYETRYKSLFRQTRKFVLEYFGYGDLPATLAAGEGVPGLVWLEGGSSKHFRCFVKKVAKQDNNAGGWDALLVNRRKREWLLTGVIGKALETCVFEDLLFGADEGQKKMLEAQDECTLEFEGEKTYSVDWRNILPIWNSECHLTQHRIPAHHAALSKRPRHPRRQQPDPGLLALCRRARPAAHSTAASHDPHDGQVL